MSDQIVLTGGDPSFMDASAIPGTIKKEADCGHEVLLSPSSVQMIVANTDVQVLCMSCSIVKANEDGGGTPHVTKAQLADLAAALPAEEIPQVMELLDRFGFKVTDDV